MPGKQVSPHLRSEQSPNKMPVAIVYENNVILDKTSLNHPRFNNFIKVNILKFKSPCNRHSVLHQTPFIRKHFNVTGS